MGFYLRDDGDDDDLCDDLNGEFLSEGVCSRCASLGDGDAKYPNLFDDEGLCDQCESCVGVWSCDEWSCGDRDVPGDAHSATPSNCFWC